MGNRLDHKKVTLKDIARKAGCSENTVSLALRDSRRISAELRGQIRKIADKLQYTPNYAARNLRVRRSGMIGIYTYPLQDAVRTALVNRLLAELHTAEYRPVLGICERSDDPWYQSAWMQTFREMRVEALVVLWAGIDELPEWCRSMPMILVGCNPNESLACDYLALDRRQAGHLGTSHLISRGCRNIMIGTDCANLFAQGCLSAMEVHGCKPYQLPFATDFNNLDQARLVGYNVAAQAPPPTGVVFNDSGYAASFIRGVLDAQRRIPEDMAVVGYDYFPWAEMLAVPLTTIEQPIEAMAAEAVRLVRQRLANPEMPPVHLVQPHTLVIRGSS